MPTLGMPRGRYFGKLFPPSDKAVRAECRMWEALYGHQDKTESQGRVASGAWNTDRKEDTGGEVGPGEKVRE